MTGKQMQ
jgi:acetylornithine/succinyldiaminopimelate/putrescine aminotransferase